MSHPAPRTETLRRAAAVWQGMKQLFGPAFMTIYGDVPSALWIEAIDGLTDEQCRAGLRVLTTERRQFPANLTEFVEACRPKQGSPRFLGTPVTPGARRIRERANPEHVAKCLASIRQKLGVAGRAPA